MILAVGDSLTNGFGVGYEYSYPRLLEKKSAIEVLNAGIDGEFSHAALLRLPKLLERKPELVILCHGANDILMQLSKEQLKKNLISMITLIKESGASTLLVGIPDYYGFGFEVEELYREVADEMNIFLEDKVLQGITLDDSLKNDDVHPNEKGYEAMADAFLKYLKQI